VLTTQMKSVGEAMAIGRTFQESFQKAMRSLETGLDGWSLPRNYKRLPQEKLVYNMRVPNPERMLAIKQALEDGVSLDKIYEYTNIDPWFLAQVGRMEWGRVVVEGFCSMADGCIAILALWE
jgi:carbamoyl-phosphate synthase large subunit